MLTNVLDVGQLILRVETETSNMCCSDSTMTHVLNLDQTGILRSNDMPGASPSRYQFGSDPRMMNTVPRAGL